MLKVSCLHFQGSFRIGFGHYSYSRSKPMAMAQEHRIVVVGDVHDVWDPQQDEKALRFLKEREMRGIQKGKIFKFQMQIEAKPDLVLFTGDFGNENVELVKAIGSLDLPKAVILGNHDCWNTGQFSKKGVDRVQTQLACLGKEHVGYDRLDFPQLKLSVVGGRPFSCGGDSLFRPKLIAARYGVNDMKESARKIYETALGAPEGHSIVFLAHNGPTGLGSKVNDICGRDWVVGGGDHGDPDLEEAISLLKNNSKFNTPLVVFGHMHKMLAYGNDLRTMLVIGDDGTFYLNGAVVPRVEHVTAERGNSCTDFLQKESSFRDGIICKMKREFTVVEMVNGKPRKITEVWVTVDEVVAKTEEFIMYQHS